MPPVSFPSRRGGDAAAPSGLHGAVPSLDALLRLRGAARQLSWTAHRRVRSSGAGTRASRFRGRGIDFAEVRGYEPGDDVRHIDWRVTARTGRAHTKIYQEERERPVLVVADLGPSSFFGTRRRLKSVAVVELASLLLWRAFEDGDRVGAIVRGVDGHEAFRPRKARDTVLRIQHRLLAACEALAERYAAGRATQEETAEGFGLADALVQARRVARPGTTVVIVSDFADGAALADDGELRRSLQRIGRHCDVDAVLVSDPFERELPAGDVYPLSDGHRRVLLDTAPEGTRRSWRDAHRDRARRVREVVLGARGRVLEAGTEDDLEVLLGGWLR
jgi:uncharacterized protein (DUF58 family)